MMVPEVDGKVPCCVCGELASVCCNVGQVEYDDGEVWHEGPCCEKCCNHGPSRWEGQSIAGGTYIRGS